MDCFIIAEAGVNHNGDLGLAKELVHAAKETGADAVKFQTFKAQTLVNTQAEKAAYQKASSSGSTQFEMLKALELSQDAHYELAALASNLGIEFMSTAFDEDSVDLLIALGVKRLKVPSGEITNPFLLRHLAKTGLPLIISTGMCSLDEVQRALDIVKPFYANPKDKLVLLHCTSNYPTAFEDVNLKAMQTLAQAFDLPVGYSDHTLGSLVPTLAVGLGAKVIEKHFTIDRSLAGPDHAASMEPAAFKALVTDIRAALLCFGEGVKEPRASELPIRELVRRSLTLKENLTKGTSLKAEHLVLLRPGSGISPHEFSKVLGQKLNKDLGQGSTLHWEDLSLA